MNYKFAVENKNYEDYSSGRVLYNQHGTTSFPVRLGSEIYQRCTEILASQDARAPYTLYDPCCGGGYLLTSLGYLHGEEISRIYASDIDEAVINLAHKNLSLLTQEGLDERIIQINKMIAAYGKESHLQALQSALRFKHILEKRKDYIDIECFAADITEGKNLSNRVSNINILITDLPYGEIVNWGGTTAEEVAISKLLDNILALLARDSVVAIVSKKKTMIKHDSYTRVEKFPIGKRQVTILQPIF